MPDFNLSAGDFRSVRGSSGADSLKRYGRVLREHWTLVVGCIVLALIGAAIYIEVAPKKYSATAQMLIAPVPAGTNYLSGLSLLHSSGEAITDTLNGASLIRTTPVATAVVTQLGLHESPDAVLGTVTATPIGQSSLVAVTATSTSPAEAQRVANAFVVQTVRTRTATLHAQLKTLIPALRQQLSAETPAQQATSGIPAELASLQQLALTDDPTVTVASLAALPTAPFTPKRKLALIAALVIGLLVGVGAAFGFDALDPRLRRESQIGDVIGFRVLARIPNSKRLRGRRAGPMLPGELAPMAREGYRVLRMVLEGGSRGHGRMYLMTGCTPSEGKTTSAINLAASLGQSGARVLLLELDMRRPMLSRTLGLEVDLGTEQVITGRASLTEALVTPANAAARFEVLAVRSPQPQLADGLSFDLVAPLLAEARAIADYVVIDSPPLTSVIDALPVVNEVDAVVVVARLGVSPLTRLARLRELLVGQGAPIAGVVLIGESPRRLPTYYSARSGEIAEVDTQAADDASELRLGSSAHRGE